MRLTWPNRISLARLLAIPVFVIGVLRIREPEGGQVYRALSLGLFVALGLADILDGYLARRLHQRTRLGSMLDPLADKLLLTSAVVLLAFPEVLTPPVPRWLAVVVVARDLFLMIGSMVVHLMTGRLHVSPRRTGRACLVAQMATVTAALGLAFLPASIRPGATVVMQGLAHLAGILTVASGLQYGWIGIRLLGEAAREPADPHAG